jgi:hypothetical protein
MKHILVVDDVRTLTIDEETEYGLVTYARTLEAVQEVPIFCVQRNSDKSFKLIYCFFNEIWLDHDLGDGETIRPFVNALELLGCEFLSQKDVFPTIRIISSNPVGRAYIRAALEKYYEVLDG